MEERRNGEDPCKQDGLKQPEGIVWLPYSIECTIYRI